MTPCTTLELSEPEASGSLWLLRSARWSILGLDTEPQFHMHVWLCAMNIKCFVPDHTHASNIYNMKSCVWCYCVKRRTSHRRIYKKPPFTSVWSPARFHSLFSDLWKRFCGWVYRKWLQVLRGKVRLTVTAFSKHPTCGHGRFGSDLPHVTGSHCHSQRPVRPF